MSVPDSVTSIGNDAFANDSSLKSFIVPDSVTEIGEACWWSCSDMEEIKLPSGLKEIGYGMFYESGLKKIEIPASVELIDEDAFWYCEELEEVTFAENASLTTIKYGAFYHTGIQELCLPDSVTDMDTNVFTYCTSLTSAKLSSNLTNIPACTFLHCENLKEIELPESLVSIGEGAFGVAALTSITIPASVTKIGAYAFLDCTALADVYFEGAMPEASTVYEATGATGAYAFGNVTANIHYPYGAAGWSEKAPVNFGGSLTMIPEGAAGGTCGTSVKWTLSQNGEMLISGSGAMDDYDDTVLPPWESLKSDIVKVTIGSGVTSIGDEAFYECDNITELVIGDSVSNIGSFAFGFCLSLTEVTIPASVTNVETNAFRDSGLTKISFIGNVPAAEQYCFTVAPSITAVSITWHEESTGWENASIDTIGGVPVSSGYDKFIYTFSSESHDWQNETHIKDATCTALAERTYTCAGCGKQKTETYGSLKSHTPGTWTIPKAAACTASGTKIQKCTACEKLLNSQTLNATGHSFGSWTVTEEATVFAAQKEKRTCKTCGTAETRSSGSVLTPTIEVNVTSIPLKVGQSTTAVQVTGLANGDYIKSWSSSKSSVASVSQSGKIKGKKKGKAVITITLASGKTATVNVKVQLTSVKTKFITITGSTDITLERGNKYNIKKQNQPVVYPLTSKQGLKFYSTNKKVATVSSGGIITAKAGGTAKIIMYSGTAKKFTFTVKVPKIKTTAISGIIKNQSIQKGMTVQLKPVLTPKNSEEKVTYKSSNKKIVSVTGSGKMTGKKKGKATITIKSGSVTYKVKVTVR